MPANHLFPAVASQDPQRQHLGISAVSTVIAASITLIGALILVGWATGYTEPKDGWRGTTSFNPLTAAGFMLGGASLFAHTTRRLARLGQVLGWGVAAIGLLQLVGILTDCALHVDQVPFSSDLHAQAISNRIAPNTAACFLLIGLSLVLAYSERLRRAGQFLLFLGLGISLSAVLGYLYGARGFAQLGQFIPMAFDTAVCFILLGFGVLTVRTDTGVIKLLSSSTMSGQMARHLALSIVFVLPLLGWVRIRGEQAGLYGPAYGTALLVICSTAVLLGVVFLGTGAFHRMEEDAQAMQERLARTEERLEMAVRGSNDGLWDWEIATGDLYVAPKFQELLGYGSDCDSMQFMKFSPEPDWIHEEDRAAMDRAIRHTESGAPLDINLRMRARDGSYRWFRVRGQAARDESGNAARIAGSITDITELKHAEAEARRAQIEAQHASGAKSEFLSRMSHELRTPLNAVLGFAQLIELDATTDHDHANVEQILKAGKHLLALIDEILDISRIEAGKLLVSVEPVRVGDVLDEVLQLMSPIAIQKSIYLITTPSKLWDEYFLVDRQRLKQVLLNLVSNGIKYNSRCGAVTLSSAITANDSIRILVEDQGHGIPDSMIDRLFTPFERLDAESGSIEGTGLGLALSKRLVELMGGKIGVESRVGVGSTFFVEFERGANPLLAVDTDVEDEPRDAIGSLDGEKTVLYIEDNQPNLELIETIFRRRSHVRLISAMQGRLGIELALQHVPDLILLDMNLPDMHGQQVLAELQADLRTKEIPVIVVSADAVSTHVESLLAEGATSYLTKPISVTQFLSVVDGALRAA